ncbi:MAG: hypothetical protein Q4A83_04440 [Bacillota bacterium]|nr:hypothetical protein [Bacillota bacterium]
MKNVKIRNTLSLLMNIATAVLVFISIMWFFGTEGSKTGSGNMAFGRTGCFVFFTNDSNILAALCCLVLAPFNIKSIISGRDEIPQWVLLLKFVGTVAVTLTMMVVLLFLGPTQGYGKMFTGVTLELHLICPLLAIISFCFFERGIVLSKKQMLWGLVPTIVYGTVYLIMVVFTEKWPDFYGFNMGGFWYISYIALPAVTCVFALALRALHNKSEKVKA